MYEKKNNLFKHIITIILVLSLVAGVVGMNVWLFKDKKVIIENINEVVEEPSGDGNNSSTNNQSDSTQNQTPVTPNTNGSTTTQGGGTTQSNGTNTQGTGTSTANLPSLSVNNSEGKLLLSLSSPLNAPPGPAVATYTITATVLPVTAQNKAVTWSVAWGDASHAGTVTDYVTVTPDSEGSTTATVACYQAFTGNILVTCTTVENGFQASCVVTYSGKPTTMSLSGLVSTGTNSYGVSTNSTYNVTVNLNNAFGQVNSQYNTLTCSLVGTGSFQTANYEYYNQTATHKWYDSSPATKNLSELVSNFMTATISGNTITLTTKKSIEGYYESSSKMDGGRTTSYTNKYYSGAENCTFKLIVTETVSGFSKEFVLNFDDTLVTGLSLSPTTLEF